MLAKNLQANTKQLKQFLLSQYFFDGIKITVGVLLPSVILYQFDMIHAGIVMSTGALSVSIPDNAGPFHHRKNAMMITLVIIFFVALITGMVNQFMLLSTVWVALCCFVFAMFNVFGARAASVGIAALVILVLGIDQHLHWQEIVVYSFYLVIGGVWYFLLSLLSYSLLPYRPAEQILGECMLHVAEFIRIKARFYNPHTDIKENYKALLDEQVLVHQYQEQVRDVLFRTRKILKDPSDAGQRLLLTSVDLIDLYDQTMATHYDYEQINREYGKYDILPAFESVIMQLADELQHIGEGMHNHETVSPVHAFAPRLALLKHKIDETEAKGVNVWVLKRVLINLRNISQRIERMYEYETQNIKLHEERKKELPKFVPHQEVDWNVFKANLSFASNHFRHAMRLAVVCVAAFIFSRTVYDTPYSYWILLTIIVIMKPGFSLTKQRNYQRVIGTIAGGIIGVLVLWAFPSHQVRFGFLLVFMVLSYSFVRLRYVVSVLFMTPFVLIVFSFSGATNNFGIIGERILDTLIGAVIAGSASYFLFPSWESYQINNILANLLKANAFYLKSIVEKNNNNPLSHSIYRLARKELYVQTANATTAFQRMLSEPKSKQKEGSKVYKFVMLNHQLSSYFATLSAQLHHEQLNDEQLRYIRSTWYALKDSYERLSEQQLHAELTITAPAMLPSEHVTVPFLQVIQQTANDTRKTTQELLALPQA